MTDKQPPPIPNHNSPCGELGSFKKLIIGIMSIQAGFVIVALSVTVNIQSKLATTSERLMQVSTRQEMIEKKADSASADAAKALAISGKAESNIAWIREGLTELKIAVRSERFKTPNN